MTARAIRSVAVDWQVEVQPGASPPAVLGTVRAAAGTATALPVQFARASGLRATTGSSTQQTGAAVLLGLPPGYRSAFGDQIRQLAGRPEGVQVAQQTAANLHVAPGDTVRIPRPGASTVSVRVAGVVDLPQANSLFQKVGAPPASQPAAPPDNVLLLPQPRFSAVTQALTSRNAGAVVTARSTSAATPPSHRTPPLRSPTSPPPPATSRPAWPGPALVGEQRRGGAGRRTQGRPVRPDPVPLPRSARRRAGRACSPPPWLPRAPTGAAGSRLSCACAGCAPARY